MIERANIRAIIANKLRGVQLSMSIASNGPKNSDDDECKLLGLVPEQI